MTHPHQLTSHEDVRRFVLGGNATFTLVSKKTGTRFTYKVQTPKDALDATNSDDKREDFRFVKLMNGPDNESQFTYLGYIRNGDYTHGRKSKVGQDAPSAKAFAWFFANVIGEGRVPDTIEVWHEGRCCVCNRKLTVPSSIASGIGPECAGRMQCY